MTQNAPLSCRDLEYLKGLIPTFQDFPAKGIAFKDITGLLAEPGALTLAVDRLALLLTACSFNCILAIESRGFVLGAPLASQRGAGLVLVRKPGKLPGTPDAFSYTCEYCSGTLEISRGAIQPGSRYLIVDDLLATGGTAKATAGYVSRKGGIVAGIAFLVELKALNGRDILAGNQVYSLLQY